MSNAESDPVKLASKLIQCASVTPEDHGALGLVESVLAEAGFECHRADRNGIVNLFARWGDKGHPRTFGFNGHTDVVPAGDPADWTVPPFSAEIRDGQLWGRGAADMKSGVAAFVAAAIDFVNTDPDTGAIVITVTGDEEGAAKDGTKAILDWMHANDEAMSVCLVGEPTCPSTMGEMIKIGRRGSMTAHFIATGIQGHVAYPHRARNPVHAITALMSRLMAEKLDDGTDHFDPSTLAVTTIDTGNAATNVIPSTCQATVNVRFNDAHTSGTLTKRLGALRDKVATEHGVEIAMEVSVSGESFLTPPGPLSELVSRAVTAETGVDPVLSTTGGTSDARFIKTHCPVVEFGLVGTTMHQVDERVKVAHVHQLKSIYGRIIRDYFG